MTILTEVLHAGEFLVTEANMHMSREQVTLLMGQNLAAGAVLGRIKRVSAAAPIPVVVGTGNGTMSKVRPGPDVQTGTYVVKCTVAAANGGTFSVTAPDGTVLPLFVLTPGAGATSNYVSSHMDFSITDGSTDFVVNDQFNLIVTAGGAVLVVGTGNGTLTLISMGSETLNGTYRAECITTVVNGGTFLVTGPDGGSVATIVILAGAGGIAVLAGKQMNFTITDGATDFAVGDYFHVVVAAGSKKVVAFAPLAVDGSEDPAGMLWEALNATAADMKGAMIARDAEVNWSELSWNAAVTSAQKASARAAFAAINIIGR